MAVKYKNPPKDNQIKHYCMDWEIRINLITPHNFIKCELMFDTWNCWIFASFLFCDFPTTTSKRFDLSFFFKKWFILFMCMYVCECIWVHVCRFPQSPEEGAGSHGAVVTGSWELPYMAPRTQFQSSGRAESALTCWVISLAPSFSPSKAIMLPSIKTLQMDYEPFIFICVSIHY